MRYICVIGCLLLCIVTASAQDTAACSRPLDTHPPAITYQYTDDNSDDELLNEQILNYLNTTGSSDGLVEAIIAAPVDNYPEMTAEVVEADFTGDITPEILVHTTQSFGAGFSDDLLFYSCMDSGFALLDTIGSGGWGGGNSPSHIIFAVDINNNQRRDVAVQFTTVEGMKNHDNIAIYEWDDTTFQTTFFLGPYYGSFGDVVIANIDNDIAELEMAIPYHYAYEEETAMAFIEYNFVRPIDMLYDWNGTTFVLECEYFTDAPTLRLAVLHSAETHRACGNYNAALQYYEQLWYDQNLEPWSSENYESFPYGVTPWIEYPEGTTDEVAYAAQLEADYLRAFAGYRIVQIKIQQGESSYAESVAAQLSNDYPIDSHGHLYTAMAIAFLDEYQATSDIHTACAAAETAFNRVRNTDDPGIAYYEEQVGERVIHYGYYFTDGRRYGSDPDNIFAVPEEIDGMVRIPICV